MFQFFFKYPSNVFAKGKFVLLSPWPVWLMMLLLVLAAGGLFWNIRQRRGLLSTARSTVIWLAQTALIALVLLMLWHPALSVATLRPQQNIVAVVVDDSASMAQADAAGGATRKAAAEQVLNSGLLNALKDKFQVRLYRMTDHLDRFDKMEQLTAAAPSLGAAVAPSEKSSDFSR